MVVITTLPKDLCPGYTRSPTCLPTSAWLRHPLKETLTPYLLNNEDPKRLYCQCLEVAARKETQKACKTTVGMKEKKKNYLLAGCLEYAPKQRLTGGAGSTPPFPAGGTQETLRPCSQLL